MVLGLTNVQVAPLLSERVAYQLPVWKTFWPLARVLGAGARPETFAYVPPTAATGSVVLRKMVKVLAASGALDASRRPSPGDTSATVGAPSPTAGPLRLDRFSALFSALFCCLVGLDGWSVNSA